MPVNKSGQILALDIGTRTICGLVMEQTDRGYRVRAAESYEHQERAMLDGQVHDVPAVAAGVQLIKNTLERRCKTTFKQAAVAAAGRTLKIATGQAEHIRSNLFEVNKKEIRALELEALRHAQSRLTEQQGKGTITGLFCPGYSVSRYYLENEPISELHGQYGRQIGVELVATFLPRVVVSSLFAVLKLADLQPSSLTLEPIAALELCVPASMRQLNIALVDIGAGTADIALVREKQIFAYAMAPVAGDEVTDALCEAYLLDFDSAEAIKRQLNYADTISFTDILGQEWQLESQEIIASLSPSIKNVADCIAAEILPLNKGAPSAVLLIGGGSLTPALPKELALALGLPESRVGVRMRENLSNITGQQGKLQGPQGVTPISIAVAAFSDGPLTFIDVTVNDQLIPLWEGFGHTVADALLAVNDNWTHLFGRPGLALTIEINGELKMIPGQGGQPPVILINNKPANLDSPLHPGDKVHFTPGKDGQAAKVKIRDLVPEAKFIYINDRKAPFVPTILLNEVAAQLDMDVPDRAKITISWAREVKEVLKAADVPAALLRQQQIPYLLGGEKFSLPRCSCGITINNQPASLDQVVYPGDRLNYILSAPAPTVQDAIEGHFTCKTPITVLVNGDQFTFPQSATKILMNGRTAKLTDQLIPGAQITVNPGRYSFIVSDLFTLIDIKQEMRPRTTLQISVNGKKASFASPLNNGDHINFSWDKIADDEKGGGNDKYSQITSSPERRQPSNNKRGSN